VLFEIFCLKKRGNTNFTYTNINKSKYHPFSKLIDMAIWEERKPGKGGIEMGSL
jgi:hypothetical protein